MPYKSDAQRRFMHAQHPEIAKRWDREMHEPGRSQQTSLKGPVKNLVKAVSERDRMNKAQKMNMSKRQFMQHQKSKRRAQAMEKRLSQKRG